MNISLSTDCSYSSPPMYSGRSGSGEPQTPGLVLRRSTMDTAEPIRRVTNPLLLQWCCIPLLEIEERTDKQKKKLRVHGKSITYQLPSTIREVSSFSCWLLSLDKAGRLLFILSGRNLGNLEEKKLYIATQYFLNSGITRMLTVNKCIAMKKRMVATMLQIKTYVSILSAIARRTEEFSP